MFGLERMLLRSTEINNEIDLTVSDDTISLDDGFTKIDLKPIFEKNEEVVNEYLVIYEGEREDGITVDVMDRDRLKAHLKDKGYNVDEVMNDVDDLRDEITIEILRLNEDFAFAMDRMGIDADNVILAQNYEENERLLDAGFIVKDGIIYSERNSKEYDVTVDTIWHESINNNVHLINKCDLENVIKHENNLSHKKEYDMEF